jgi:hypothetical protein
MYESIKEACLCLRAPGRVSRRYSTQRLLDEFPLLKNSYCYGKIYAAICIHGNEEMPTAFTCFETEPGQRGNELKRNRNKIKIDYTEN